MPQKINNINPLIDEYPLNVFQTKPQAYNYPLENKFYTISKFLSLNGIELKYLIYLDFKEYKIEINPYCMVIKIVLAFQMFQNVLELTIYKPNWKLI